MDDEQQAFPICSQSFPIYLLPEHCENCTGEDDLEYARKLQNEFQNEFVNQPNTSGTTCQFCKKSVHIDNFFILDDCSHKFCVDCLR